MNYFSSFSSVCLVFTCMLRATSAELPSDYTLPTSPGPYVSTESMADGFSKRQPIVLTTYFYWYDATTNAHIVNYDGSDALTDHPPTLDGMSYRNPDWHQRQLRDMVDAGIDVALPVYWGTPGTAESWSNVGLPPLVAAREWLLSEGRPAPKIGMFYDTSTLRHNEELLEACRRLFLSVLVRIPASKRKTLTVHSQWRSDSWQQTPFSIE